MGLWVAALTVKKIAGNGLHSRKLLISLVIHIVHVSRFGLFNFFMTNHFVSKLQLPVFSTVSTSMSILDSLSDNVRVLPRLVKIQCCYVH